MKGDMGNTVRCGMTCRPPHHNMGKKEQFRKREKKTRTTRRTETQEKRKK